MICCHNLKCSHPRIFVTWWCKLILRLFDSTELYFGISNLIDIGLQIYVRIRKSEFVIRNTFRKWKLASYFLYRKQFCLDWTRTGFPSCTGKGLFYSRYEMTGSDQEGDYTLNIFPVQLEDDAVFQCQVISYFQIFSRQNENVLDCPLTPKKVAWAVQSIFRAN